MMTALIGDNATVTTTIITWCVIFFRALLALFAAEIGLRYLCWWWDERGYIDTRLIRDLMYGIANVQVGFFIFAIYALVVARTPSGPLALAVYFAGDAFITYGNLYHLIPAWRMRGLNVARQTIGRFVLAIGIAGASIYWEHIPR